MTPSRTPGDLLERILDERARALARAPATPAAEPAGQPYVRFVLDSVRFALELPTARRVVRPAWMTRIPATPPYLRQVVYVDGRVVSVLDLSVLLSRPGAEHRRGGSLLLAEARGARLAVLADEVGGLVHVDTGALACSSPRPPGPAAPFIRGVTADMTVVLDGARMVTELRAAARNRKESPS